MLSNPTGSHEFERFLGLLGKRVPLKGFTGFKGGLDTESKSIACLLVCLLVCLFVCLFVAEVVVR